MAKKEIDKEELAAWEKVAEAGCVHVETMGSMLKGKSLAANYPELKQYITTFNVHLTYLLNPDGDTTGKKGAKSLVKADARTQKSLNFINSKPSLKLDAVDHKIRTGTFQYIPAIEKESKYWFNKSVSWWRNKGDAWMITGCLCDFLDVAKNAYCLHQGDLIKAEQSTHLDTIVRETLPDKYYEFITNTKNLNGLSEIAKLSIKAANAKKENLDILEIIGAKSLVSSTQKMKL